MALPSGSWEGSFITNEDIARLVRLRRIPPQVITRAPGTEVEPQLEPGERVVFGAHFDRGLGLPASPFFRHFLDFFGLQLHHLPANAFVTLRCYVAFMEGYAGLWPDVEFWSRLFYLKAQTADGHLRVCGAASIYSCMSTPFPRIPTVDSVKKWQMSFFYVKSANSGFDWVNLPEYNPEPPTAQQHWGTNYKPADPEAEVNLLWCYLRDCFANDRLCAADLLCCYASRRVLPLQARAHKICHMSGRLDLTRMSKLELNKAQIAKRVNSVSQAKLPDNWNWGMEPYSGNDLPPLTFARQQVEDGDLAHKDWTPDHVDPADQAGDDENPDAADQAAQGHDDPPPSPQPHEEEPEADVPTSSAPIRPVPLAARAPVTSAASASATCAASASASKGRKRPTERTTAQLEGRHQVFQGCRLRPGLWSGVAASAAKEGADSATSATLAHANRRPAAFYGGGAFFSCTFARCSRLRLSERAGSPRRSTFY
ncbi:hypothetical protein QYE76_002703 [Lolium multiflorum]|uniref:Transposase (putative) gypsy type domain-containing protein n=1 Tax=Lolium multiflorum TaxID=4521 RepID=A0AAD8RNQ2_LOLMU|nr:hypothetical protein QYE76_002703 [Lolium multiflorum]